MEKCTGVCSGFHDSWAPCRLALLPVGVGGRAVGTGAGSVTVREQSVSLIGPPRPRSTITLLCLSPPLPWQHHMMAQNVEISMLSLCVYVLYISWNLHYIIHYGVVILVRHVIAEPDLPDKKSKGHHARIVVAGS